MFLALTMTLGAAPSADNAAAEAEANNPSKKVSLLRVPDEGIQPQAAMDERGTIHLIYFKGKPSAGDIFYVHSKDGAAFSKPIRVNSKPGSAIAIGNIRGAQLALGKNNRVHVAWMSGKQEPIGDTKASPMLYARLNDDGTAFEGQRNVIQAAVGLDGGGSVAADPQGNVYVTWHAPTPGQKGENNRRVWVAKSTDDGKTFAKEEPASDEATGACGCCGMNAFADHSGRIYILYRAAQDSVHRDMFLLASKKNTANSFEGQRLQEWETSNCPMSLGSFAETKGGMLAAWETKDQVYFTTFNPETCKIAPFRAAPGDARGRKHPAVAGNDKGESILVWTEGMGWERGGSLAWQVYDKNGKPTALKGRAEGVPVWSLVAVVARPDGGFMVIY
jgi:hypothetical protein